MDSFQKSILTSLSKKPSLTKILVDKLYIETSISLKDAEALYAIALILLQEGKNEGSSLYINYAYLIIAKTSFKINNFNALYDFSINNGYFPIARKIWDLGLIDNPNILHVLTSISTDEFKKDDKILTLEQSNIFTKFLSSNKKHICLVAPTSYGKSKLVYEHIKKNNELDCIGIIVPTKALINQVYFDVKDNFPDRKIILHDQNFDEVDKRVLAIITQERGNRLLKQGLVFDMIYIDEAHEIFNFNFSHNLNNRSLILSRFINLCDKMNENLRIIYLSPLINDSSNLKTKKSQQIVEYRINDNLKIHDINFLSINGKHQKYDKYINIFVDISETDFLNYIFGRLYNEVVHP